MIFDGLFYKKRLYILFLLPLLLAAIGFCGYLYAVEIAVPERVLSLVRIPFLERMEVAWVYRGILILLVSYLLYYANAVYRFLMHLSILPPLFYVLITGGLVACSANVYVLLSALSLMFAFLGLQRGIRDNQERAAVFNLGFFVALAVVFSPKILLLLAWGFGVLLFTGRSTLKDMLAVLFGILTVVFFLVFYYYWLDCPDRLWLEFWDILTAGKSDLGFTIYSQIGMGVLVLLLIMSLVAVYRYYPVTIVNQRRAIAAVITLLFFLVANLLLIPGFSADFFYLLGIPLSYLYAHYFISQRSRFMGDVWFIVLLAGCGLLMF